jgi:quercetin dioxygenase-like cupin family protein
MADKVWVNEIKVDLLEPLEGFQGLWKRFVLPSPENLGMIFLMGKINPGEVAGWHAHPDPEIFFVLQGKGEARWKVEGIEAA